MRLIDILEIQYLFNMVDSLEILRVLFFDVVGDVLDFFVLRKIILLNTSNFHNPLDYFSFFGFFGVAWEQEVDLVP